MIWKSNDNYPAPKSGQQAFLKEYSADIFPLVSIIIPIFERPHYFKLALESVLNQTYLNLDIMITDNSNNDETEKLMQPYLKKDKRIKYYHHGDFDRGNKLRFGRDVLVVINDYLV
ncbi:MAG: glycosyltransferase [Selenomonadaceae bacterium]|nr:glycosyltransferase [Selenomonadaceae bacterium]